MNMQKEFNICIIKPDNHEFSEIFIDQALYYRYEFAKFGYSTSIHYNLLRKDVTNFVFGAWLGFESSLKINYPCIFINLEQLGPKASNEISPQYIELLKTSPVIDYDTANVRYYATSNTVPIAPLLYAPYLNNPESIPLEDRPIDVLFFGVLNERRISVIERLLKVGIKIEFIKKPTFGAELKNLIEKSKCVLNIHAYESSVFEQARASICLSRGTPLISERNINTNPHFAYEESIFWSELEGLENFFLNFFKTNKFYIEAREKIHNFIIKSNDTYDYKKISTIAYEFLKIHREINIYKKEISSLRVIIYAPPYDETSGGCVALYRLAILLMNKGVNVSIWNWLRIHPNESRFLNGKTNTSFNAASKGDSSIINPLSADLKEANIDDIFNSIVIYPEIVEGNPLGAPNVIRWLLNKPGKITNSISYSPNDHFIYWEDSYIDINHNMKFLAKLSLSLVYSYKYFNTNKPTRSNNCYLIRKGFLRDHNAHPKDSICIDGKNHDEICEIFNQSKYLYSYDHNTAYLNFAIMCGCIPIIIPFQDLTFNDLKPNESARYGISYGEANIEWARQTAAKAIEEIALQKKSESNDIDQFINKLIYLN